jgi:hypothetical protein
VLSNAIVFLKKKKMGKKFNKKILIAFPNQKPTKKVGLRIKPSGPKSQLHKATPN